MKRTTTSLPIAFVLGFLAALPTVSGCDKAADRTLHVFQLQSGETYVGAFRIDMSNLPPDAIETETQTGGPGDPVTQITLNMDYPIEIVLKLADTSEPTDESVGRTVQGAAAD